MIHSVEEIIIVIFKFRKNISIDHIYGISRIHGFINQNGIRLYEFSDSLE